MGHNSDNAYLNLTAEQQRQLDGGRIYPALRAERIMLQIQGKDLSIEETRENILTMMKKKMIERYSLLPDMVMGLFKSLTGQTDMKRGVA